MVAPATNGAIAQVASALRCHRTAQILHPIICTYSTVGDTRRKRRLVEFDPVDVNAPSPKPHQRESRGHPAREIIPLVGQNPFCPIHPLPPAHLPSSLVKKSPNRKAR